MLSNWWICVEVGDMDERLEEDIDDVNPLCDIGDEEDIDSGKMYKAGEGVSVTEENEEEDDNNDVGSE